jgi:glycosyltransferase involved in cell wall biosynthesis
LKFELHFAGYWDKRNGYGAVFARELAAAESAGYARHLGLLADDQLISAMDSAAALIHAPVEEAFGLVVAESLARNLKFFGFATGGVVDIAAGVEGAELFPPANWPALEEAVVRWIAAGCPRPVAASGTMQERYHPSVIARRHLEIYREVLEKKD